MRTLRMPWQKELEEEEEESGCALAFQLLSTTTSTELRGDRAPEGPPRNLKAAIGMIARPAAFLTEPPQEEVDSLPRAVEGDAGVEKTLTSRGPLPDRRSGIRTTMQEDQLPKPDLCVLTPRRSSSLKRPSKTTNCHESTRCFWQRPKKRGLMLRPTVMRRKTRPMMPSSLTTCKASICPRTRRLKMTSRRGTSLEMTTSHGFHDGMKACLTGTRARPSNPIRATWRQHTAFLFLQAGDELRDDDKPWVPRWNESLFDGHESTSFESNQSYMETAHSFFVPDLTLLVDAKGLFAYLQEKICRYHICIYCNKMFSSVEACRNHMADKAHRKVNFEKDDGAVELAKFYRSETSVVEFDGFQSASFLDLDKETPQLVLPNGTRLGHRSLQQFYKQKFRTSENRVAAGMTKSFRDLEKKLAVRAEMKRRNNVLVKSSAFAKGNSKAISSIFSFKAAFADNKARRAVVHHWGGGGGGSHYHMAGSKQFLKGNKVKGVISRHSRQGAKMQAARVKRHAGYKGDSGR
eukprot:gnl/TRDRNA2_/TRDRNA2_160902_c0_seq1.p1 gnl/TRDRNA2_/TRDRNA2_160902_c0~~gnl/TRDRNA2_/TRDRNA2_160902_c0_seq1.p1  ORF type:complete len:520 (-),score=62.98 gnl/TRDRNA2_/TRDRNA2_160902_c0_seq1:43-1602(-)